MNTTQERSNQLVNTIKAVLLNEGALNLDYISSNSIKTPVELKQELDSVKAQLSHRIKNHPLLDEITKIDHARFFVGQYIHFAADIPRITGIRYGLCHDEEIRRNLLGVMIEEDGSYTGAKFNRPSHYTLAKVSAKSLGVDEAPPIHHATLTLMAALEQQYKSSLIAGLASSYAREGIYPELMPIISKKLTQANPKVNPIFFDIHGVADVEHAQTALDSLFKLCNPTELPKIKLAVELGLSLFLTWYDSLYLEIILHRAS